MIIKIVEVIIYGNVLGLLLTNLSSNNFTGFLSIQNCTRPTHILITSLSCILIYMIHT